MVSEVAESARRGGNQPGEAVRRAVVECEVVECEVVERRNDAANGWTATRALAARQSRTASSPAANNTFTTPESSPRKADTSSRPKLALVRSTSAQLSRLLVGSTGATLS